MKLYLAVENDEYELPVYIEESTTILARKLGASVGTVKSCISRSKHGSNHNRVKGLILLSVEV